MRSRSVYVPKEIIEYLYHVPNKFNHGWMNLTSYRYEIEIEISFIVLGISLDPHRKINS